jgi:hypothetical protein
MTAAIFTAETTFVATMSIASELTSGRIRHGVVMSGNLRVSKAFIQASDNVTVSSRDFRSKSVNGAEKSLK